MIDEYDYVVVGGGSSGCVAAATLAESGARVLVLEQGDRAEETPETLRSDGYKDAFVNDRLMIERFSVPQTGCGKRKIFLGSGRGAGGSGAINAMVYTRGSREDFDAWGEGWRWDDVVPDFEAVEQKLDPRRREPTSFTETCIRAAESTGFRRKADLNDGDLSRVLGYEWMNYRGGERRNSYVAFVKDAPRPNLELRTGARVRRVLFDRGRTAYGVEYDHDGVRRTSKAKVEVVLAAGTLETPRILQLSGVGPGALCAEHDIEVVHDLRGVGANLHDHPNVTLFFRASREIDCFYPQLYGFLRLRETPGEPDSCLVFYPARSSLKEGMMRMLPAMALPEAMHNAGTAPRAMRTAISGLFERPFVERFVRNVWGIVVILGKPKSRGTLRIRSPHPLDAPAIDPAYFAESEDFDVMLKGVEAARRIAKTDAAKELGARELLPGPMGATAGGVAAFVRNNSMTTYHYAGTCALGDGPDSVVDRRLRVRGIDRLRVADASVMPIAPVAALNAPSMMIGRRAARFALEDAR
ncbi:MAG: GMC family oxidoreductase [Polyangiaceae bacterium]|nr:GMC family oxidoreductase [Polyangiaceae bacterium]